MRKVFVSTSCLKNPKNVIRVLEQYEKAEIKNVELGSIHSHFNIKLLKKFNFNFLIHNYFPPPKNPFNFNLASSRKIIRDNSLNLAKKAIDLCCEVESPQYTFHAGFTVDPLKLGRPFPKNKIRSREKSVITYIESVDNLIDYAKNRGVLIAMEPNVVQKFNLVKGKNELCLFAEYFEIKKILKRFKKNEFGLLLDLGHTAVTANWLNFDKNKFVADCKSRVTVIHISNNNGLKDEHKSLTTKCWQVSKLHLFKKIPIVLETMNLPIIKIKQNIKIAQEF